MAHKYTSFFAAYSALVSKFDDAQKYKDWALLNAQGAYSGCSDPVDKTHFGYLCYAVECLCTVFNHVADLNESYYWQSDLYESIYWAAQGEAPPEYELTMDKILDVIWESDKLRWFHFINYIDSMRAGIWNTEIYDKHLEDWYRHFST